MDRLKNIKEKTEFNWFNYPDTGKFALTFNLKKDDFDWLIEQAEKVEQLEKDIKFHEKLTAEYISSKYE